MSCNILNLSYCPYIHRSIVGAGLAATAVVCACLAIVVAVVPGLELL